MKIRNGFVSNSSSSSFIVIFPKIPKNVNDVKNILFSPEQEYYYSPYGDDHYNIDDVAKTVWNDICGQKVNDFAEAEREIMSGSIDDNDAPDYSDFTNIKDYSERWAEYDNAREKYAKKKIKEFFNLRELKLKKINEEKVTDMSFYIFEYSDNDISYFSSLEHGNLFDKLKHIKISKH